MRKLLLLLLVLPAALLACSSARADLVLAENGASDYQIVIPDHAADPLADQWLLVTAKLMEAAFHKNGFDVPVVRESKRALDKPGIYLGATDFARKNGIRIDFDDWTYVMKVLGRNLAIAGNDHEDDGLIATSPNSSLALLGTVKGACDFLREYAGVRFLFMSMDQNKYLMSNGPMPLIRPDGSLDIDTRSIAFVPAKRITVPAALDLRKKPVMLANLVTSSNYETFYFIANNFFPIRNSVEGPTVRWDRVISLGEYGKSHPEYFALLPNGKRASDRASGYIPSQHVGEVPLCIANPDVQELMIQAVQDQINKGASSVLIFPLDSFLLSHCNCEQCDRFYGMTAKTYQEVEARARFGRLWQVYFFIANRLQETHPKARVVVWDYQDTTIDSDFVHDAGKLPENLIPKFQYGSVQNFDRLKGIQIPAGIAGLAETFTGFSYLGPYAPERTPEYAAGVAKALAHNHVMWSTPDGGMGYVRGMQAPTYYVFGRMMDDPSADWRAIQEEFVTAAFGEVASSMKEFFDVLHRQLALFSDNFNWGMPLWRASRQRVDSLNRWYFLSVFTPEYLSKANASLTWAEKRAQSPDVKARLHLIRIEFDYLRGLAKILTLQDAWELRPTQASLDAVLDALDEWRAELTALAGGAGQSAFKPLDDWPEMRPFNGHDYHHASLLQRSYQQTWYSTCLAWDTAAIRAGILTNPHRIKVPAATLAPAIDSKAWDDAPMVTFRKPNGMPVVDTRTTLKVLRDGDSIYVRIDSQFPEVNPEDLLTPKTEEDVLKQEYVNIGIRPSADGPIYRLAAGPVDGVRYDAVLKPGGKEDASWNGPWQFAYQVAGEKARSPHNPWLTWTAWFKIPFSAFGVAAPVTGDAWGFNAGRQAPSMIWNNAGSVTDPQALGKLEF